MLNNLFPFIPVHAPYSVHDENKSVINKNSGSLSCFSGPFPIKPQSTLANNEFQLPHTNGSDRKKDTN